MYVRRRHRKRIVAGVIGLIIIIVLFFLILSIQQSSFDNEDDDPIRTTKTTPTQQQTIPGSEPDDDPESKPIPEPNTDPEPATCENECSTSSCDDNEYIACETNADDCKEEVNKGYIIGRCDVACVEDTDCSAGEICTQYQCEAPTVYVSCGDNQCNIGEFGVCAQDCGNEQEPNLNTYPAMVFDSSSELIDNFYIIVGNAQPQYQIDAAYSIIDDLKQTDPTINAPTVIKTASDIANTPTGNILFILGTECDNEFYAFQGMQCTPFSSTTPAYLQVIPGQQYFWINIYGQSSQLPNAVYSLINAQSLNIQGTAYQLSA